MKSRSRHRRARSRRVIIASVVCACVVIAVLVVAKRNAAGASSSVEGVEAPLSSGSAEAVAGAATSASPAQSATTTAPSTPAPAPTATHTSAENADELATSKSARIIESLPSGSVSIAATNLDTGQSYSYGAAGGMRTASVVKLDFLEILLLQHQRADTHLDADEDSDAVAMIEHSDNSAAEDIYEDIGESDAMDATNPDLGVSTASTVPGSSGYWGLTTTSAHDQVVLLRNLTGADSPLSAASRSYALGLMRNVESDQRWGSPAAADPGTTVAVKNGWLSVDEDNGRWAINSDALITVDGDLVAISVLTQHNDTEQSGITLVESLAKVAAAAVG